MAIRLVHEHLADRHSLERPEDAHARLTAGTRVLLLQGRACDNDAPR